MKHALFVVGLLLALPAHAEPVTLEQLKAARAFVALELHIPSLPLPMVVQTPEAWATIHTRAYAAYLNGVVYLPPWFRWEWDSKYLVHEMTHAAQAYEGRAFPCHDAKEREAYLLQNAWALKFGYETVSSAFIESMSACR